MFKKRIYFFIPFLILALTACGQPDSGSFQDPASAESNHSSYDWKTEDWQYSDDMYAGKTLYVEKYISGLEYQPEQAYDDHSSEYKCWGANFYVLDKFFTLEGSS